jgi:ribose 5-phosphate isomerase B
MRTENNGDILHREGGALRIAFGCDDETEVTHAVEQELRSRGHEVAAYPVDRWPEVARRVAEDVGSGAVEQGVLFCWTGTGSAMAANKIPGVRAALVWEPWIAEGARRWNDANLLVMSSQRISTEVARAILDAWFGVTGPDPDEAANIASLAELDRRDRS